MFIFQFIHSFSAFIHTPKSTQRVHSTKQTNNQTIYFPRYELFPLCSRIAHEQDNSCCCHRTNLSVSQWFSCFTARHTEARHDYPHQNRVRHLHSPHACALRTGPLLKQHPVFPVTPSDPHNRFFPQFLSPFFTFSLLTASLVPTVPLQPPNCTTTATTQRDPFSVRHEGRACAERRVPALPRDDRPPRAAHLPPRAPSRAPRGRPRRHHRAHRGPHRHHPHHTRPSRCSHSHGPRVNTTTTTTRA